MSHSNQRAGGRGWERKRMLIAEGVGELPAVCLQQPPSSDVLTGGAQDLLLVSPSFQALHCCPHQKQNRF